MEKALLTIWQCGLATHWFEAVPSLSNNTDVNWNVNDAFLTKHKTEATTSFAKPSIDLPETISLPNLGPLDWGQVRFRTSYTIDSKRGVGALLLRSWHKKKIVTAVLAWKEEKFSIGI
jgi:hypothetical protein